MRHTFVEYIPDAVENGVLYISIPFATAVHNCACGCGNEVVTPFSPADWSLIFEGASVSLHPSVGNWSFPCRSHYWIRRSQVDWAPTWSDEEIAAGRTVDRLAKDNLLRQAPRRNDLAEGQPTGRGWWQRLKDWLGS